MARHLSNLPSIEDDNDGLDAIVTPSSVPVVQSVRGDEAVTRAARPVQGTYDSGNTTGFIAVVGEADTKRAARRKYKRNTKKTNYAVTDPYDIRGYRKGRGGKGKKVIRVLSSILFVIGIILLIGAGGMWLKAQWDYHKQDVEIQKKQSYAIISDDPYTAPIVNWGKLFADNPDIVGWILIPGTTVNFPVYQGADNDTYLHTSADGEYALGGEIFLDYENTAPGMLDSQSIIYGHHLRNGAMFKAVADMDNQAYFDSIDTVWYVTQDAQYEMVPLMCYYATPYELDVRRISFDSTEEFHSYLYTILNKSVTSRADASAVIENTDHVLALFTCNYLDEMGGDGRTIVICVPKSSLPAETSYEG